VANLLIPMRLPGTVGAANPVLVTGIGVSAHRGLRGVVMRLRSWRVPRLSHVIEKITWTVLLARLDLRCRSTSSACRPGMRVFFGGKDYLAIFLPSQGEAIILENDSNPLRHQESSN
jgi:hypothetical protein